MSDTDDTEALLLIPPNFFISDCTPSDNSGEFSSFRSTVINVGQTSMIPNVKNYNQINSLDNQISIIENYHTESETTSNSIPIEKLDLISENEHAEFTPTKLTQSTPLSNRKKLNILSATSSETVTNRNFIKEIDNFLNCDQNEMPNKSKTSFVQLSYPCNQNQSTLQMDNDIFKENLISLDDLWNDKYQNSCNRFQSESLNLQEERLRRQHCEKSIQVLQTRLLEYQQKISVAINVDKNKDQAIKQLKDINSKLSTELLSLKNECVELQEKNKHFHDLDENYKQAILTLNEFKKSNELLQLKYENLLKSSNEIRDINKKQINEFEIRLSNNMENEKILTKEIEELKIQLNQEKQKNSSCKIELRDTCEEIKLLKEKIFNSYEKTRDDRIKIEKLEKEKKSLQETLEIYQTKEKNHLRDMDTQKISLKMYYQKQLEDVVKQKLNEFQNQVDTMHERLKEENKQREHTIAERAIKQMELINQKNEEEIKLINEKHNEEMSLYRIQLINSAKTIDHLQEKLKMYQTKRADIAERLHNIMETQWQKALEILTNPLNNTLDDTSQSNQVDKFKNSKINEKLCQKLNFDNSQESKCYSEKLNEYIENLLKQSPRDLDKLNELLDLNKKGIIKMEQSSHGKGKPPWR